MPYLSRSESVVLAAMLGFVLYLMVLLWAFAERRLWRVALVLGALPAVGWIFILGPPGAHGGLAIAGA